jgi:hypothetical protein
MDRAVAVEIMDIVAAGRELGALDILSLKIADDEERKAFRRTLAQIMALYTDLVVSVAHQYPDLDPDKPARRN